LLNQTRNKRGLIFIFALFALWLARSLGDQLRRTMRAKFLCHFLLLFSLLLVLQPLLAKAERAGWNEPGRPPGYDQSGPLQINIDFFNLTAATGGDFYFWAPGEFAAATGLLHVPVASDPIALAYGSTGGLFTRTVEAPVDGTISRLSFFAGAQILDKLSLTRPDGRSVEANAAGVSVQTFRHMRIVTLIDPEPGLWKAEMSGSGSFELAVRYQSNRNWLEERGLEGIDLIDFNFVELRGRPGHQGLFPLSEPLQAGTMQRCRITLSGGIKQPSIDLVSATGAVLSGVRLEEESDIAADEFIGSCLVPDQPFRVRVRGKDMQGWPFQRITAGLTEPAEKRVPRGQTHK
jgi:hypothetical protein